MDAEHLPNGIVAPLDRLARRLSAWAQAHRDCTLADLETEVQAAWHAVAPAVLSGLMTATQRSLEPGLQRDHPRCPVCGQTAPIDRWRPRQVVTVCGPVRWSRPWAHCCRCRRGWSPTDRTLGLVPQQRLSRPL